MSISNLIAILSITLAILSFCFALYDRVGRSATKSYAAEREFLHLKRNQEQFLQSLDMLADTQDEIKERIQEIDIRLQYWLQEKDK